MSEQFYNPLETPEKPDVNLVFDLQDGTDEQVSIIVVHHDRPYFLNICLQSIHVMTNISNYEIIVVDNNSGQESQEYLDVLEEEGIKVVRNKENLYWSAAANRGAAIANPKSKYLVFMHCDTVVLNHSWIDAMINVSIANGVGLVGNKLKSYYIQGQKADFVEEWCLLMTRECWEDCGPWSEELPLIGNAFAMTLKAQKLGYKPTAINNNIVHHYRAIAVAPNVWGKLNQEASRILPRVMQQIQNG